MYGTAGLWLRKELDDDVYNYSRLRLDPTMTTTMTTTAITSTATTFLDSLILVQMSNDCFCVPIA